MIWGNLQRLKKKAFIKILDKDKEENNVPAFPFEACKDVKHTLMPGIHIHTIVTHYNRITSKKTLNTN